MKGTAQVVKRGLLLVTAGFVAVGFGCASMQGGGVKTADSSSQVQVVEKKVMVKDPTMFPLQAPYFPAPSNIDLCGEPVPLSNQDVYERFDREFTVIVYNHAQVYLWLK